MFNSSVLDIAIGMIAIYLILSLACTAAHEALERFTMWRAADLERGLQEFLQDREGHETGIVARLYNHPLIDSLYRGDYVPPFHRPNAGVIPPAYVRVKKSAVALWGVIGRWVRGLYRDTKVSPTTKFIPPAYIPARNFALALLDMIQTGGAGKPSGAFGAAPPPPPPPRDGVRPAASFDATIASPPDVGPSPTSSLRQAIDSSDLLKDFPEVRTALYSLVDAAGNDMNQVRVNIEAWYNSGMDRVSGWFKQRSQVISLVLGVVVTVLANADSIAMGNALARDKALREALVATAQDYSKKEVAAKKEGTEPSKPRDFLKSDLEILRPLGLPVGWQRDDIRWDLASTLHRLLGWTITALAVSLGAPFWFDVLNKFMIVRSTVKPHEKSPEEKSRD